LIKALKAQNKSEGSPQKVSAKQIKNFLYGKLCFRTENYVSSVSPLNLKEKFDTILCLSTTKWIHLNFGDVGIKTLFLKAYEQLDENGIFIVEGHPWKSYKKVKHLSTTVKENF